MSEPHLYDHRDDDPHGLCRHEIERLEADRDSWKTRAAFLVVEGVSDAISGTDFESDKDIADEIDEEMRGMGDHWSSVPHLVETT